MKFLKILGGALLVLFLIGGAAVAFGPKKYDVNRSLVVNASLAKTYNLVQNYNNWTVWSPWQQKDPAVKNTYTGNPGQVGHSMTWVGDKEKSGEGTMIFTKVDSYKKLDYLLCFKVPFEDTSKGYFSFEPVDSLHTKVTWNMNGEVSAMMRVFTIVSNMDKMIGPDFEQGLKNIDSVAKGY